MAYIEQDDEDEKQQGQGQQPNGLMQIGQGASGATDTTTSPVQGSAAAATNPNAQPVSQDAGQTPGRYVNFQNYFNANKDAATATADKLTDTITKQAGDAAQALGAQQATYANDVKAGAAGAKLSPGMTLSGGNTPPPAWPAPSTGMGAAAGAKGAANAGSNVTLAPTKAPTPAPAPAAPAGPAMPSWANVLGLGSLTPKPAAPVSGAPIAMALGPVGYGGNFTTPTGVSTSKDGGVSDDATKTQYTGPNSLSDSSDWGTLLGKVGKASSAANAATTDGGRQALLQQQQAGQQYGAGSSNFDAGLAGTAGGDKFDKLKAQFGGLQKQMDDANTASQGQSEAARAQVADYNGRVDAKDARLKSAADAQTALDAEKDKYNDVHDAEGQKIQHDLGLDGQNYQKGGWGQVDFGKVGDDLTGTFGARGFGEGSDRTYDAQSDAGLFEQVAQDNGYKGDETDIRTMYEQMSPQDMAEMQLIATGPKTGDTAIDNMRGTSTVHPYYNGLPSKIKGSERGRYVQAAMKKFMDRMKKKYSWK
jgi:hypothetical protein